MPINIDGLTQQELVELNHRVIERLRFFESVQIHEDMMKFNPGERVSFESSGRRQLGILVKYNQKTVTVITESGQKWNISPHLLSKVKEAKPITDKLGKVIDMHYK